METTKLGKLTISYLDSKEFHSIKNEIYNTGIYEVDTDKADPVILDIGAHIGLATIYFKSRFPNAHIFAFEPNPEVFKLLEENIWQNGLEGIETYNIAIAGSKGKRKLYIADGEDSWSSNSSFTKGSWSGVEKQREIEVEARRLADILDQFEVVDILKMDVEGAEFEILKDIKKRMNKVMQLIVEIHPGKRERFKESKAVLDAYNLRSEYWQNGKEVREPDYSKLFILKSYQENSK